MKFNKLPSAKYLHECFEYNQETGKVFWKERPKYHFKCPRRWKQFNNKRAGSEAGTLSSKGYLVVRFTVDGKATNTFLQRICWKLLTGEDPKCVIDHIDGNPLNNRANNLRDVSHQNNVASMKKSKRDGLQGACYDKSRNKWAVGIRIDGKRVNLGRFPTELEAHQVYMKAKQERLKELN